MDWYVGQTLQLVRADGAFELRLGEDVLGRLIRPGQVMVAETREGRWELRHPRRTVAKIDAVDAASGEGAASYRRRVLLPGATIRGLSPLTYRLRKPLGRSQWRLSETSAVLDLASASDRFGVDLTIVGQPSVFADLGLLALLCCYVVLLAASTATGAMTTPDVIGP